MEYAIETHNIKKSFVQRVKGKKETVKAVKGVTLAVKKGEIFGFLGPNGAGKTTTMRMLTTLLPIDEGEVLIAGFDMRKQAKEVRRHIGYVSQLGGSNMSASGRENLMLQGQLYGMSREESLRRTDELVELFDLGDLIDRRVKTYSGGQKRRLEIALGMIHRPDILFLDEPTTGLDPQNRANLWEQIRKLRANGTTIFLTTHYLEEADELSDRLAIMDHGKVITIGTPRELKQQISGDVIVIQPKSESDITKTQDYLSKQPFVRETHMDGESLFLYVGDGPQVLPKIFELLNPINVGIVSVSLSQPSLDDVFLKQTGRSLRDANV